MGRIFLGHIGGTRLFSCASCDTILTNRSELISTRFTGATGRAFLFNKAVNLNFSETQDRVMLTGRHIVRDVTCKNCEAKVGWMYEFATEENQRYKEGKVILERALITESEGFEETPAPVSTHTRNIYARTNTNNADNDTFPQQASSTGSGAAAAAVGSTESGSGRIASLSSSSSRNNRNISSGGDDTVNIGGGGTAGDRDQHRPTRFSVGTGSGNRFRQQISITGAGIRPSNTTVTAQPILTTDIAGDEDDTNNRMEADVDRISARMVETVARFPRMLQDLSGAIGATFFPPPLPVVGQQDRHHVSTTAGQPLVVGSTLGGTSSRSLILSPQVSALFRPSPLLTTLGRTGMLIPREIFNYYGISPFYDDYDDDTSANNASSSVVSAAADRRANNTLVGGTTTTTSSSNSANSGTTGVGGTAFGSVVRRNIPLPNVLVGGVPSSSSSTSTTATQHHPPRRCNPINQQNRYAQTSPSQTSILPPPPAHQRTTTRITVAATNRTTDVSSFSHDDNVINVIIPLRAQPPITASPSVISTALNSATVAADTAMSTGGGRNTMVGSNIANSSTNTTSLGGYDDLLLGEPSLDSSPVTSSVVTDHPMMMTSFDLSGGGSGTSFEGEIQRQRDDDYSHVTSVSAAMTETPTPIILADIIIPVVGNGGDTNNVPSNGYHHVAPLASSSLTNTANGFDITLPVSLLPPVLHPPLGEIRSSIENETTALDISGDGISGSNSLHRAIILSARNHPCPHHQHHHHHLPSSHARRSRGSSHHQNLHNLSNTTTEEPHQHYHLRHHHHHHYQQTRLHESRVAELPHNLTNTTTDDDNCNYATVAASTSTQSSSHVQAPQFQFQHGGSENVPRHFSNHHPYHHPQHHNHPHGSHHHNYHHRRPNNPHFRRSQQQHDCYRSHDASRVSQLRGGNVIRRYHANAAPAHSHHLVVSTPHHLTSSTNQSVSSSCLTAQNSLPSGCNSLEIGVEADRNNQSDSTISSDSSTPSSNNSNSINHLLVSSDNSNSIDCNDNVGSGQINTSSVVSCGGPQITPQSALNIAQVPVQFTAGYLNMNFSTINIGSEESMNISEDLIDFGESSSMSNN